MSNIMAALFILTFHLLVTCVPVQYLYRYLIIVRKSEVTNARYFGMLTVPITVSIFDSLIFYLSANVMPVCNDGMLKHLDVSQNIQNHYVPCIQFDLSFLAAKLLLVSAAVMMITIAVIIIWTSVAVYQNLSQKAAVSSNEWSLQRQITTTLIIQVSVITLSGLIPANCMIINALLGTEFGWVSVLSSCILPLPPVLNPLFTIITVKSFCSAVHSTIKNRILPTPSRSLKVSNVVIPSMTK
uniref:G protein-coupled receptor n=1 Tax=Panagrellus redivivus TaxID=6233 RepID=A0A7E4VA97_PANRE